MTQDNLYRSTSRRANAQHTSMFLRMLWRAALHRSGRAASALLAVAVAASTATAMLNLYVDVQAKLRAEFRKYGANLVVLAREGHELPKEALSTVKAILGNSGIVVPFAYAVARTPDGHSVVVVGTDLDGVQKLDSWWAVTAWPRASHDALVGNRTLAVLGPLGEPFELSFQGRTVRLNSSGRLQTGAAEDSRIYISLAEFTDWTHLPYSTIEISASGSAAEVSAIIDRLAQALPAADVRPVRQVTQAEGRVLGKMQATLLVATVLIILTAALCLLSTLTGWVADRRRDFAIMKALGASGRMIQGFFAAEAAALGATGAVIGFAIGIGVAIWIGQANFHAPVSPRFSILPIIFVGGVAIALVAAVLPISLLRRVQPANILRGE